LQPLKWALSLCREAPRASAGSKQDNNKREGRDQRAEQQQTNRFLNVHVKDDEFDS